MRVQFALTGDLVVLEVGEAGVRALVWLLEGGQRHALGQLEVAARLEEHAALLVVLDERPVVVAEQILYGDAVLLAQRQPNRVAVADLALRERVRTKQLLPSTTPKHAYQHTQNSQAPKQHFCLNCDLLPRLICGTAL